MQASMDGERGCAEHGVDAVVCVLPCVGRQHGSSHGTWHSVVDVGEQIVVQRMLAVRTKNISELIPPARKIEFETCKINENTADLGVLKHISKKKFFTSFHLSLHFLFHLLSSFSSCSLLLSFFSLLLSFFFSSCLLSFLLSIFSLLSSLVLSFIFSLFSSLVLCFIFSLLCGFLSCLVLSYFIFCCILFFSCLVFSCLVLFCLLLSSLLVSLLCRLPFSLSLSYFSVSLSISVSVSVFLRVVLWSCVVCVPAPRAHVETHVRVVPVHTGTF